MRSYASIDRIEGEIAVCEVEMINVIEAEQVPYEDRETVMFDVKLQEINFDLGEEIHESDIIVVEHDGVNVLFSCCIDKEEKTRRTEYLNQLLG